MKNVKHLFAGFAVGVVLAIAPSCGTTKACSSVTCSTGCCDAKGECQPGTSNGACGQLGGTCQVCQIAQACSLGTCAQTNGNGGGSGNGGGGGTTGGGGGTTGGGGGTTGGGGGTTGGGGGTTGGGGGTTGGGGGTCDGCFFQNMCYHPANTNNNTLCGIGGVQCATCSGTQTCQNYVCVSGTGGGGGTTGGGGGTTGGGGGTTGGGGGTTVSVGTTCTSSTQCSGLGGGAYCKLQTTPFGATAPSTYPSGFCTLPCAGTCPGTAICAGGVSSYPYLFNEVDRFCTPACASTANCTSGFQCIPVEPLGTGTASRSGCFLNLQTGGTFTGGGNPTKAGNPCTSDAICANPPDPILAACQMTADFPNGYCLASSDLAPPDTWCTAAGKVEMGFPLPDAGTSYYCLGSCTTPGSVGSSRTGYTCFRKSSTEPTVGVLWPKCTGAADCASIVGMTACNTSTGFCCDTATGTTNCRFSLAP